MDKQKIIDKIVSAARGSRNLSQKEFQASGAGVGLTTVRYHFGSWNNAVEAAGLEPNLRGRGRPETRSRTNPDIVYLEAIIQVTQKLEKPPTEAEFSALKIFSMRPYYNRWGTFSKARKMAYMTLGNPLSGNVH